MEQSTPTKASKLESLSKDELQKFIRKQAISCKDLKKRVAELEGALDEEKQEVSHLESEKKEWISRGVTAEFEKKDKIVKKDKELELAAQLGAEMLEENDELREGMQTYKKEHEESIMEKDKLSEEKQILDDSLKKLEEEYKSSVLEIQELKDKLQTREKEHDNLKKVDTENANLKKKIKELEHAISNPAKLHKLKEEFGELSKENKSIKKASVLADQDRKIKSEHLLNFDKDLKQLRQDIAEKQRKIKEQQTTIESLKTTNTELTGTLEEFKTKVQELTEDVQKGNVEKEKHMKSIKSMKTKFERSSLIEDELRKQLNIIVGERDELMKKNLKLSQKQKSKDFTDNVKKPGMQSTVNLEQQIAVLEETIKDISCSKDHYQQEVMLKEQCMLQLRGEMEELHRKNSISGNKELDSITYELDNVKMELITVNKELENSITEKEALQLMMVEVISERDHSVQSLSICEKKLNDVKMNLDIKILEVEELRRQVIEHSTANYSEIYLHTQQGEMSNLQKDLEHLDNQYKQVSSENKMLKEESESLITTKTEYENDLGEIKIKLDEYKTENMTLKNEVVQINKLIEKYGYNSVNDFNIFVSSLNSDIDSSMEKLKHLAVEKEQVDLKCMEMETNLKNQYITIQEKDTNINHLDNELLNLKNEFDSSMEKLKHLAVEKEQVDLKCMEIETNLKNQYITIQEKDNNINHLDDELLNLKNEFQVSIDRNSEVLRQKDNEIARLCNTEVTTENTNTNTEPVTSEIQELKKKIVDYKKKMMNLKQAFNDAHVEIQTLKTSEENHSNEVLEKHNAIEYLKAELVDLRQSFKDKEEKLTLSENLIEDLENRLSEKENHTLQLSKELEESQHIIEELRCLINQNNDDLCELAKRYETVEDKHKYLEESSSHLEEDYKLLGNKNASLVNDKNQVIEELTQIKVANSNLENELQFALNKIGELEHMLREKCEVIDDKDVLLKEKDDKGNKFKGVAIKAKKELEALRIKYNQETTSLEQEVTTLNEEVTFLEKELVRHKTECSRYEEEIEKIQGGIKNIHIQLQNEQEMSLSLQSNKEELVMKIETMTVTLCTYENKVEELTSTIDNGRKEKEASNTELNKLKELLKVSDETIKNNDIELEKLKPELESIRKSLECALKESSQMSLMNLEIGDYEKTVNNLQMKLDIKEKQFTESQQTIDKMTDTQNTLKDEITAVKMENTDLEGRNEKLKTKFADFEKEISDKQKEQEETLSSINKLNDIIENLRQYNEEMKIEIVNLNGENTSLSMEMKNSIEVSEKTHQMMEVKFARVSSDFLTSQRENQIMRQEFEQYKVRAHNVLKQQKSRQTEEDNEHGENEKIVELEEVIRNLKQKLQASNESLHELEDTHRELEVEYEGLQTRHHQFIEDMSEKELAWKQRLTHVKLEASSKVLEYQDKLQILQNENEVLLMDSKEQSDLTTLSNSEREKYLAEISNLNEELVKQKKTRVETPPNALSIQKQDSVDSRNDGYSSFNFKLVSERQEGEGMDSRELEIIDTLSQRSSSSHTPLSPTNATLLEKLLSPVESPSTFSPQPPVSLREELLLSKSALTTSIKKNEHMTALIRESEANACRLADQAKVLKEEIRRLERNDQRDKALSNMEYLKNVIIKFLKVGPVEKEQLIPVLSTMLKFSDEEKKFIVEYTKGEGESREEGGSWSSYVYRWTSLS